MTVLVENHQQQPHDATSELELKVFKVLAAFSQSVEKSLITSQDNVTDLYKTLNCQLPSQPELKQINQIASDSNIGLLTIQMVRTVIQRSDALSKQISTLQQYVKNNNISNNTINNNNNSNNSNAEIKAYKLEIESLKKKITRLQSQQTETTTPSPSSNLPKSQSSSQISSSQPSQPTTNLNITEEEEDEIISTENNNIETITTTLKVRSDDMRDSSDWDTKYQTEMQLNTLLSEFFKNEIEISAADQTSLDEFETTPRENNNNSNRSSNSSSSNLNNTAEVITNGHASISSGTSPIATPSITDKTLSSSGSFTSQAHSPLTHSASSTSIPSSSSPSSSSNNLAYDSPSRQSAAPKKAYLTDLLDQIDLENNTPSKDKKKGKFKFF